MAGEGDPVLGMGSYEAANELPAEPEIPQSPAHAWASRGAPTADERLADLQPGEVDGTVVPPFRSISRDAYLAAIAGAGVARRSLSAPTALVNLSDLVAIQGSVNRERLGQHLANPNMVAPGTRAPGHGMLVDRPVVVRKNGRLLIHDGHHRLTARVLRGFDTAKVRFVDLDA